MVKENKPQVGIQQKRAIDAAVSAVDEKTRRVTVSFSSEQPVNRWWGPEILQHDEGNVNLDRINQIGVALFNHDRGYVIGKIENARLDSNEKRCYADIIFDEDPDSDLIFQKVNRGTLKGVSVGYSVDVWEEVVTNKLSSNGRFQGPCYIATRWTPLEISIVSVPADDTVGVGRELDETGAQNTLPNKEDERGMKTNTNTQIPAPENNPSNEREQAIQLERQRVSEITTLCREFEADPTEYISSGASVDNVRAAILEKLKRERTPIPAGAVEVKREEVEKIRDAASDAILMRAGVRVEKPAEGAKELKGMSLRSLAIDCLVRSGKTNAHRFNSEDLFREALTSDSAFSSILSNAVNKSMATAYNAAKPTYQAWTGRGSNPDFKTATHYQISEAGELVKMTQSGEFKFDEMSDNGVSKAVATFGREWGITRQALINDDIGVLTRIPEAYVRAASRGINKLVYSMLGNNPKIYDGKELFHSNHSNMGTPGTIGTATIGEARKSMRRQKNLRGKETLNIAPTFLIVPAALETSAQKFLISLSDPDENNSNVSNVFRNSLTLVVDAELDDYSETSYYLAASPADIDTIEVTYLNGADMPKLESQVGFDFLGMKWRIYIDYGVTVLDYRGLYKNNGAQS